MPESNYLLKTCGHFTCENPLKMLRLQSTSCAKKQNCCKAEVETYSSNVSKRLKSWYLPPANEVLGQGNIFTPVCHSVHRGGHACLLGGERVWLLGGACVVAPGGHAWLLWGGVHGYSGACMHGCSRGACVVAREGACMVAWGGVRGFIWGACVVLFKGGMHGLFGGACMVFQFFGYNEIRSMSGRYASYWNASLL